jgi:hypothetical protein
MNTGCCASVLLLFGVVLSAIKAAPSQTEAEFISLLAIRLSRIDIHRLLALEGIAPSKWMIDRPVAHMV